jgi:hypothetical protein
VSALVEVCMYEYICVVDVCLCMNMYAYASIVDRIDIRGFWKYLYAFINR